MSVIFCLKNELISQENKVMSHPRTVNKTPFLLYQISQQKNDDSVTKQHIAMPAIDKTTALHLPRHYALT